MPEPEDQSALIAAPRGTADRYGPLLIPVRLDADDDPLGGFRSEGTIDDGGWSDDPLDAFRPESGGAAASRFLEISEDAPAEETAPVVAQAWQETAPSGRPLGTTAALSLLAIAVAFGGGFLYVVGAGDRVRSVFGTTLAGDAAPAPAVSTIAPETSSATGPVESSTPPVAGGGEAIPERIPAPALATDAPGPPPNPASDASTRSSRRSNSEVDRVAAKAQTPTGASSTRGQLEITSAPAGARVFVDGRPAGITPFTIRGVAAARHEVVVSQGSAVVNRTVDVAAGSTARVFVPLAAPAVVDQTGTFVIQSPLPFRIVEDGRTLGVSSASSPVAIAAGRHHLDLVNEDIEFRVAVNVEIVAGKPTQLSVPLPTGTLSLNASPWAEVFVDGRSLGLTPIANAQVSVGPHDLAWRHPQLGEKRSTIVVGAQTPARASMDLKQ